MQDGHTELFARRFVASILVYACVCVCMRVVQSLRRMLLRSRDTQREADIPYTQIPIVAELQGQDILLVVGRRVEQALPELVHLLHLDPPQRLCGWVRVRTCMR